ncbi:MAG: hypothetical protein N2441_07855 [Rhodocyclaceae bacterium]|nr:hypothetical protein [Rhodocyclaceae bacterium]
MWLRKRHKKRFEQVCRAWQVGDEHRRKRLAVRETLKNRCKRLMDKARLASEVPSSASVESGASVSLFAYTGAAFADASAFVVKLAKRHPAAGLSMIAYAS